MKKPALLYLNGQFVPEAEAQVSVFDRSFLYGDGLFETIRLHKGRPVFWAKHMERMGQGAVRCGFKFPIDWVELGFLAIELAKRNSIAAGVLRVHLSRGIGVRGYRSRGATKHALLMTVGTLKHKGFHHPPINTIISKKTFLPMGDETSEYKTASKLPHIIACDEAYMESADECIILNAKGRVAECGSGNVFIRNRDKWITPARAEGPILGILRDGLVQVLSGIGIPLLESKISPKDLMNASDVFRSSTIGGITPIMKIENKTVGTSNHLESIDFIRGIADQLIITDHEIPW